jgi:ABC-type multidrug transport system fused ATPase/permease subunit
LLFLVRVGLVFCSPLLLQLIIQHVERPEEPAWQGVLYCTGLVVTNSLAVVLDHHGLQRVVVAAIQMRNACVSAVYRKTLRLSSVARQRFTTGEITNFMSVDAQRLVDSVPFSFFLIIGPVELVLCLGLLYRLLGTAVLAGLGVLVLVTPLNLWASRRGETLLEEQLQAKDQRIKLMSEILAGIKVLKLYAWEKPFIAAIGEVRGKEIAVLRWIAKLWALVNLTFASVPFLMTLATFLTFVYSDPVNNVLTADLIFVSLSLFNLIRTPLTLFPLALMDTIKLFVSVRRIHDFLNADELEEQVGEGADQEADGAEVPAAAIEVLDGSFTWEDREQPTLAGVSLRVRPGALVGVVGPVGAGKSSLLSALLGEMACVAGRAKVRGSLALLAQQPWIQNLSLRENILFGASYEAGRYEEAVRVCGLEPDLHLLAAGDATEIGENGINLSGGQKQRVALARLVYRRAEVNLLDDPLAALDAEVGRAVFQQVLGPDGVLAGSTRLLVTHSTGVLQHLDWVVVVRKGRLVDQGTYSDLVAKGALEGVLGQGTGGREEEMEGEGKKRDGPLKEDETDAARLTDDEEALTGEVRWSVYLQYIRAIGRVIFGFNFLMYFVCEGLGAGGNYVLSRWADDPSSGKEATRTRYLLIYAGIGLLQTGLFFIKELTLFMACASASKAIHVELLDKVMHKAMGFFDSNPTGRILNRFSSDIDTVDGTIPFQMDDLMNCVLEVGAILVIIVYSTPYFLFMLLPLAVLYLLLQRLYISSSRQIKRLDMISKSPIFSHFSETVTGAASVRAFGAAERFTEESERLVAANNQCLFLSLCSNRWLGLRLESLGNLVILGASLLAVLGRQHLSPGMAGLSVTYSLMVTETLNWLVRMVCALETNAVSLERIFQYSGEGEEAAWETVGDEAAEAGWPGAGQLEVKDLTVRYRPDLQPVLRDISLVLRPGERVGVVGRTGAGKSSLTLALWRVLEAEAGSITLDGVNLATLGLQRLRRALTIIPQDPVLFSASLRFNLDPGSEHTDTRILECLQLAGLGEAGRDLDKEVQERGENFSVGQRQLICLARALLRSSRLLVLDEATAAVDPATDAVVQRTVREHFKHCTVITIAHRLHTVLDSDRVVVLDAGRVGEEGPPAELLADPASTLHRLARHAGIIGPGGSLAKPAEPDHATDHQKSE